MSEVCREMGISEQTLYHWKRKFRGMGVAEVRRLRVLEDENRKLKQLVADLSLAKQMLHDVLRKKPLSLLRGGPVQISAGHLSGKRTKGLRGIDAAPGKPQVSERVR